jgi:hypothetical protein
MNTFGKIAVVGAVVVVGSFVVVAHSDSPTTTSSGWTAPLDGTIPARIGSEWLRIEPAVLHLACVVEASSLSVDN